ncbi:MAG: hypothetical protein Kow006_05940 [Gammaproteobacteria bacterium]
MIIALRQESPCPMINEPALQRHVKRLEHGIRPEGVEPVPAIGAETLACYEQRARELRSALWVGGIRQVTKALLGVVRPRFAGSK